jgi:transposase
LFFSRRRNAVKVLFFTGDGLAIFYRRLERGTFELPNAAAAG